MNVIDVNNELGFVQVAVPAAQTVTFNGTGVDCSAYKGILKIVQEVGAVTGTTPTLAGKIQDSADNSTFADVAGATFASVTTANNLQSIGLDSRLVRRYIRYVGTLGGTTPNFTMSVGFIGQQHIQ